MRLKTAYREKNDSPEPEIIPPETNNVPRFEVNGINAGTPVEQKPDAIAAVDIPAEQKSDNSANNVDLALKYQVEALRHNEQIGRERMEQQRQAQLMRQAQLADMRPPSREEKIAAWKRDGLSAANEQFLLQHPQLIDFPEILHLASQEALASGVKPESDNFRHAVKQHFDTAMRRLQAEAEHHSPHRNSSPHPTQNSQQSQQHDPQPWSAHLCPEKYRRMIALYLYRRVLTSALNKSRSLTRAASVTSSTHGIS